MEKEAQKTVELMDKVPEDKSRELISGLLQGMDTVMEKKSKIQRINLLKRSLTSGGPLTIQDIKTALSEAAIACTDVLEMVQKAKSIAQLHKK